MPLRAENAVNARGGHHRLPPVDVVRVTDAFMCFPYLIFVLALAAALGPGVANVIVAFCLLGWTVVDTTCLAVRRRGARVPWFDGDTHSAGSDREVEIVEPDRAQDQPAPPEAAQAKIDLEPR